MPFSASKNNIQKSSICYPLSAGITEYITSARNGSQKAGNVCVCKVIEKKKKQVKPGFTTYQPQLKAFRALSNIEEKLKKEKRKEKSKNLKKW